jgi:hypothetical protein
MHGSIRLSDINSKKWYAKRCFCTIIGVVFLLLIVVIVTIVLLVKNASEKSTLLLNGQERLQLTLLLSDNPTHIHYTRVSTNVYPGGYELYRLNILAKRNPEQQYRLLGDFLRRSLFNKSTYEMHLPKCSIMFALTSVDHPEDWRGMLFGTTKYPLPNLPYPYVCFLSVLPADRRHRLGSILLNHFINEMVNDLGAEKS